MFVGYFGFALFVIGALVICAGLTSHYLCGVDYATSAKVAGIGGRAVQLAFACLLTTAIVSLVRSRVGLSQTEELALSFFSLILGCALVFASHGNSQWRKNDERD